MIGKLRDFNLQERSEKTRNEVRTAKGKIKPDQYSKNQKNRQIASEKLDTRNKNEIPKMYSTEEDSPFKTGDGDVEIKVSIMNAELTDAESKLFEERYFIPIERPESPRKVC